MGPLYAREVSLFCLESFPFAISQRKARPNAWFLLTSNDSYFGRWSPPHPRDLRPPCPFPVPPVRSAFRGGLCCTPTFRVPIGMSQPTRALPYSPRPPVVLHSLRSRYFYARTRDPAPYRFAVIYSPPPSLFSFSLTGSPAAETLEEGPLRASPGKDIFLKGEREEHLMGPSFLTSYSHGAEFNERWPLLPSMGWRTLFKCTITLRRPLVDSTCMEAAIRV